MNFYLKYIKSLIIAIYNREGKYPAGIILIHCHLVLSPRQV